MLDYHPRLLVPTLRRALATFPAVAVVGPRQAGKTTLLRNELDYRYVSLERPDVRAAALADPVAFLLENPPPLVLDEIQYAPDLLHYIKERIDALRSPGQWVLTGSQGFPLMQDLSETLAGRVAILHLDPLSVTEAVGASSPENIDDLLGLVFGPAVRAVECSDGIELVDWALRGGFPEIRLNPRVDRQLWLSSFVQTYLERDVRTLRNVGDLGAFGRFLALVAAREAQGLERAKLAREVGASVPTIRAWLGVLEASGVLTLVRPFHRNFGKRVVKAPRLHLLDPGLVSWLQGLHTSEAIAHGPSLGPLAESSVVGEWLKAFHARGEQPALYYWRSSAGDEVDLVIERNQRLYGIEVKATATPTAHHAAGLRRWLDLAGPEAKGVLACRVTRPRTIAPGVRAVPWHLGWCDTSSSTGR